MNYGKKMRELRINSSLSQDKMAALLNIKRSTYKEYELQNSIIPMKHLNQFCNYFHVSIDYIMGYNSCPKYNNSKREINMITSSKRLRDFRCKNNYTLVTLAGILRSDYSLISKYESGKYLISTTFMNELCKRFSLSWDYLLGKIDGPMYIK